MQHKIMQNITTVFNNTKSVYLKLQTGQKKKQL